MKEEAVLTDKRNGKQKLNRFLRELSNRIQENLEDDTISELELTFDPAYLEVDRILNTTEIFPVVHPHQAALVNNKWQEKCINIISKLLNYVKSDVAYGVYFLEPLDPADEGNAHYFKSVKYPIDLGTIHNRLFIGYYERPIDFWKDLGSVFKNCQAVYTNRVGDIRIIGDTLRQIAIFLYKNWHAE